MSKILTSLLVLAEVFWSLEGYEWAQAWVQEKTLLRSALPRRVQDRKNQNTLEIHLQPLEDCYRMTNGNTFLKAYLLNNTDTVTVLTRADATLPEINSQILIGSTWQSFQKASPVSCGNSYWKQTLGREQALLLHYDHNERGSIQVFFRLNFIQGGHTIYSNPISVQIDEAAYHRVQQAK